MKKMVVDSFNNWGLRIGRHTLKLMKKRGHLKLSFQKPYILRLAHVLKCVIRKEDGKTGSLPIWKIATGGFRHIDLLVHVQYIPSSLHIRVIEYNAS